MLPLVPAFGLSSDFGFTSFGFGISFGAVPVPGWIIGAPAVQHVGPQFECLLLQRDFSLSSRFGRSAALEPQVLHGSGTLTGAHAGTGAQQSPDFLPNFSFNRSRRPGFFSQPHGAHLLQPAPLLTTAGAGAAGATGTGSAPASAAEDISRNAAVTVAILRKSLDDVKRSTSRFKHRPCRDEIVKQGNANNHNSTARSAVAPRAPTFAEGTDLPRAPTAPALGGLRRTSWSCSVSEHPF